MKKAIRTMILVTAFALIAVLGLMALVRLAPSDPAVWHVDPASTLTATGSPCLDAITVARNGARAACLLPGTPADILSRLDTIALATPRTSRLAGSPQTGRITWITRTALMGYPDYTTAAATPTPDGTRLDIFARQRFGGGDWGVNAARLTAWLKDF